jgi:hypothetical protein
MTTKETSTEADGHQCSAGERQVSELFRTAFAALPVPQNLVVLNVNAQLLCC